MTNRKSLIYYIIHITFFCFLLIVGNILSSCGSDTVAPNNQNNTNKGSDTIPPVCRIIEPLKGTTVNGVITVRATCTDNIGVSKTELLVNGAIESTLNKAPWDFIWNAQSKREGEYILQVKATDSSGNSTISPEVNVHIQSSFVLNLVNTTYTKMNITAQGQTTQIVNPGDTAKFVYFTNPGTVSYTASTSGRTSVGTQIGLLMEWKNTYDVKGTSYILRNLVVSSDFFMLYLKNSGISTFNKLIVNAGLKDEVTDNSFSLPPNGAKYAIGYYNALTNTEIRLYKDDGLGGYVYWTQGNHFKFDGTENQSLTLENTKYGISTSDMGSLIKTHSSLVQLSANSDYSFTR